MDQISPARLESGTLPFMVSASTSKQFMDKPIFGNVFFLGSKLVNEIPNKSRNLLRTHNYLVHPEILQGLPTGVNSMAKSLMMDTFILCHCLCHHIVYSLCPQECRGLTPCVCPGTERARGLAQTLLNVPYGEGDGEKLDVYIPSTNSLGVTAMPSTHGHASNMQSHR